MKQKEMELYQQWLDLAVDDPDLQAELKDISGDADAITDRFYKDLEFGTGGLRGVIGAGANRLNIYTIRRATQGLANYVQEAFDKPSVAIAYDSRIKSDVFAKAAAEVLAANGIQVHLYPELTPTPMLSFAVRYLHCSAGIVVTASHNPAKYNGYKVYGADGCQMTLVDAERVLTKINALQMFGDTEQTAFDEALASGMISYISKEVNEAYFAKVLEQGIHTDLCATSGLKVVYTPLNGTGNKPVRTILQKIGIQDVTVVPEQENPDGNFTTCPFPNPEIREALTLGLKLCEEVKPDLLLATDPDADRCGIAVPSENGYVLFSGNEVGAMLLEYICNERTKLGTMPKNLADRQDDCNTDLVRCDCEELWREVFEVLTGFKFIGEQITWLEEKGKIPLCFALRRATATCGSYVRDMDAVVASMLIVEMAAYYRTQGISRFRRVMPCIRYGVSVTPSRAWS